MLTGATFLEILGTIAFAVSGAMTAVDKKMDIFGVAILGLTTAVGGGVIRDLILGSTPPAVFRNPVYAVMALVVSVIVFLKPVRRLLGKKERVPELILLVMDSLGLAIFTAIGVRAGFDCVDEPTVFLSVFVGVITGVGGGILRDVMAENTPYVFVKHFYASASLIGALSMALLWDLLGPTYSMLLCTAVVFVLRMLAAKFHWRLPRVD